MTARLETPEPRPALKPTPQTEIVTAHVTKELKSVGNGLLDHVTAESEAVKESVADRLAKHYGDFMAMVSKQDAKADEILAWAKRSRYTPLLVGGAMVVCFAAGFWLRGAL